MAESHNTTNVLPERLANYAAAIDRTRPLKPMPKKRMGPQHSGGFVYLMKGTGGLFKIGCSRIPQDRIDRLADSLPFKVEIIHLIPTASKRQAERYLHGLFAGKHEFGEWYRLDEQDVERFCAMKEMPEGWDTPIDVAA